MLFKYSKVNNIFLIYFRKYTFHRVCFASFIKAVCKAGQYGTVVAETLDCLPCPRNMYQPQPAQFGCLPCPTNHITLLEGATSLEQCNLGIKSKFFCHLDRPTHAYETCDADRQQRDYSCIYD